LNGQQRGLPLVFLNQFAGDFGLAKAAGAIEILNALHIFFE